MSGLLCSIDAIRYLFFYMDTSKYQQEMGYLKDDYFKSVIRGLGNVFLTNFHWIFALQYYRASSILDILLSNKHSDQQIL